MAPIIKIPDSKTPEDNSEDVHVQAITANNDAIQYCYAIRNEVFVQEQQVPIDIEMDSHDETAIHILASCNGEPCGAARLVISTAEEEEDSAGITTTTTKVGKIGRVCVVASHRRRGIGRKIVEFAVEELRRLLGSGAKARLGAQTHALNFYKSMGFRLIPGEEYMAAGGVPHRDMELQL